MKPQGTVTERLADVIQVLQLARKTGVLTAERALRNGLLERGTVQLLNGQVADANVNGYQGREAFNVLMAWQDCYFVFQVAPPTGPLPSSSASLPQYAAHTEPLPTDRNGQTPLPSLNSSGAPYRLYRVEDVLAQFSAMGLSRQHRQLFLLLDGQRMMKDLVRLVGRGPDEVEALLADLARAGLIHQ